jgi:hypothetical protein
LCQPHARAQAQHDLPEGIVALTIGVPLHRRAPCLPRDPAAPGQEWKVMEGNLLPSGGCLPKALPLYW